MEHPGKVPAFYGSATRPPAAIGNTPPNGYKKPPGVEPTIVEGGGLETGTESLRLDSLRFEGATRPRTLGRDFDATWGSFARGGIE